MYLLRNMRGDTLSTHPNLEGAKLSALHHVENGDIINWWPGLYSHWGTVKRKKGVQTLFEIVQSSLADSKIGD